jgi:uncharacterized protein YcbK (DUF882 family)
MRHLLGYAFVALLGVGVAGAARAGRPSPAPPAKVPQKPSPNGSEAPARATPERAPSGGQTFPALKPLRIFSRNFATTLEVELYDEQGRVDEAAASRLDAILVGERAPEQTSGISIDRRTLQLLFRAAYHFKAPQIEIISAYRKPGRRREGPHASGRAIDFKLPRVPAATLAAYLRTLPRVGVGVYTHPRTQYVHLDVREHSFHWIDASPPGRSWRERSLGSSKLATRDAAYSRASDWPEGTTPPASAVR